MKKILKRLILIYFLIVLVKFILTYLVPAPSAFSDGYVYAKIARSFFYNLEFSIHGMVYNHYHPLYSIILSPAYAFGKMIVIYPVMKIINVLISSLVIFPAFLISKEFTNSKKAFYASILISLLPSNFIFSSYLLAENVFYPLFLFSIYFIYKAFVSNKFYWSFLAGTSIGLTYLSKVNGIVLFGVLAVMGACRIFKREKLELPKFFVIFLTAILVISPWLIRSFFLQGSFLGGYASEASTIFDLNSFLLKFSIQYVLYFGLLILSAGVILPMLISKRIFSEKFLPFTIPALSSIFLTLVIAANHNVQLLASNLVADVPAKYLPWLAGRLLGRYIDVVIPLVIIIGIISLKEKISLKKTIFFSLILMFTSQAVLSQLFPINHVSLSYIGLTDFLLKFLVNFPMNIIIIAVLLGIIPFIFYKLRLNFNKIFTLLAIFFLLVNVLNFGMISYNSNNFWYKGEQMQLAIWLDSYDSKVSTILFDERDCTERILKLDQTSICEPSKVATVMGAWLNDDIFIGDVTNTSNVDFIITRHELDLPLIKTSESGIFIYSTKK